MIKTGKYQGWKGSKVDAMLSNYELNKGTWVNVSWIHYVYLKFFGYIVRVK